MKKQFIPPTVYFLTASIYTQDTVGVSTTDGANDNDRAPARLIAPTSVNQVLSQTADQK